jgi:hypothetical protein
MVKESGRRGHVPLILMVSPNQMCDELAQRSMERRFAEQDELGHPPQAVS